MGFAEDIGAGAIAGAVGALAMAGVMMAGKEAGMVQQPFPVTVEQRAERELGVAGNTGANEEMAAALGGHLMIGATWGALYGVLQSAVGFQPFPAGPLYGAAVYAVDMAGIGPALNLDRGPWNVPTSTAGKRLAMHLLYGAVTAYTYPRVEQYLAPSRPSARQHFAGRNWHQPANAPVNWQPPAERYSTIGDSAQAAVNEPYTAPY